MNKKIIVFICILSLFLPLFPSFDFTVYASDSVSDDVVNGGGGGHSRNNTYTGILGQFNQYLINNGYVLNDSSTITYNVLDSVLEDNFGVDLEDYVSIYNPTDYASIYNNFATQNPDFDFDQLALLLNEYGKQYAVDNTPYVLYHTYHASDFATLLQKDNNSALWIQNFISRCNGLNKNCIYFFQPNTTYYRVHGNSNYGNHHFDVYKFDLDFIDNFYIYRKSGVNSSTIWDLSNLFKYYPRGAVGDMSGFQIWITEKDNTVSSISCNTATYYSVGGFSSFSSVNITSFGNLNNLPLYYYNDGSTFCFNGGFFLVHDSVPITYFMIFKSYQDFYDFSVGQSPVYEFESDIVLPDNLPDDFNYQRLYDIISDSLGSASGNMANVINDVANKYLLQQLDLLHDINNALNDGNGQSWLRRIYGILDYNFPLTLQAFENLQQAFQNISISGGGSDLTHINRVLDEINDKLGFMIEEPLTNADIEDMNDLKNLASQKFPFCVFSDIVAISVILNQTPEQPHWQIPLKLPGSQSANNIEVDLSWYEEVRPVVQGVFIFIFIVGLLALSVKVFSALKS